MEKKKKDPEKQGFFGLNSHETKLSTKSSFWGATAARELKYVTGRK